MMQTESTQQMTVRRLPVPLTEEQWEIVEMLATLERRSMAQQVVVMLNEWIKTNNKGAK